MSFQIRNFLSVSLISAALALPAAAQTTPAPEAAPAAPATTSEAQVPAPAEPKIVEDLFLGEESAPLTIYEYASFTCPHCAHSRCR